MSIMSLQKHQKSLMVLYLLLASALRLFRLGYQSEWNDEALSVVIANGTTTQIITNQFHSFQPPGYYLLLHYWQSWFGNNDSALRLPSAFAGILAIAVMFSLGKLLLGYKMGLWAALLTAVLPFQVFYSQELRTYSLLFLFCTITIFSYTKLWLDGQNVKRRWWFVYAISITCGMYLHFLFSLIIIALGLFFLLGKLFRNNLISWHNFILAHVALGIAYLPMIMWLLNQTSQGQYAKLDVSFAGYISLPLAFTVGYFLPSELMMAAYAIILIVVIITILQSIRALYFSKNPTQPLVFILTIYWIPITLVYLTSLIFQPFTRARLMMTAVPGLYLLLAWGAVIPKERRVNQFLLILLIGIAFIANYNFFFVSAYQKVPVRDVVASFVQNQVEPDDTLIYANDSGFRLFHRYSPSQIHALYWDENHKLKNNYVLPEVIELTGGYIIEPSDKLTGQFWLILYQDFDVELQQSILQHFQERYQQIDYYEQYNIQMYRFQASD